MGERVEETTAQTLQNFFLKSDLRLRVEIFIDAISHVDGVKMLCVKKFNDGTLRFYAVWDVKDGDHGKVTNVWEESFSGYDRDRADLLVIQYLQAEYEKLKETSLQFKLAENGTLWSREIEESN
jgi:hypothetical protein